MSALQARDVERARLAKGFEQEGGGKSHRVFRLHMDGQRTGVATHTSHNDQEVNDFLQQMMARQLNLPKGEFVRLVECTLGGEDYAAKMVEGGYVVLSSAKPAKEASKSKGKAKGKGGKGRK